MIKGGYYIKARKIQESAIAHAAPCVREIWDWLLREANHTDNNVCKRGQCIRTYKDIINGLSWYAGWRKMAYSKNDCENTVKWLKKHTMITTTKTTRGMVITIVNYDKYQNPENYESHTAYATNTTRKPQTSHTINKNEKNDKEERTDTDPTAPSAVGSEVNEMISLFKEVNPSYQTLYARIPQRKAVERLLKIYGREKLELMIKALPTINAKQYWPKSTTPAQLENNLAIYKAKSEEQRSKKDIIGFAI